MRRLSMMFFTIFILTIIYIIIYILKNLENTVDIPAIPKIISLVSLLLGIICGLFHGIIKESNKKMFDNSDYIKRIKRQYPITTKDMFTDDTLTPDERRQFDYWEKEFKE